jgi:alpha-galactosidase
MRTTKIAHASPFSGSPKINLASIFGASPNKPFLLRIPATGERPIKFSAQCLPEGLTLKENIITGCVLKEGNYEVTITAENAISKTTKIVTFEIFPNNLLVTPLLGFTTWNAFETSVSQKNVSDTAKAMIKLGIAEYGYGYVNLDSGWQHKYGGELDAIQPNPKFPDMKAMVDEIHSLGLKCGIYSTPMLTAWGCPNEYESIPGCTVGEPDIRFPDTTGGKGTAAKEKTNVKVFRFHNQNYGLYYITS